MKLNLKGFTLVELLVASAVMAVGLVFVLGALGRCSTSLALARRTVTASSLLNAKLWDLDLEHRGNNGTEEGEWEGDFEEPNQMFHWTQTVVPLTANLTEVAVGNASGGTSIDPGNTSSAWEESFLEETVTVGWSQGRQKRNVTITRYVRRKATDKETSP
jgi:prepilin-type N-terminal cleavage/methylation domain-containing protein